MNTYKIIFYVNGTRAETIVKARCQADAEKLVKLQYPNCNISINSVTRL